MANPFKDWTPQMVDQFNRHNRRKPVSIDNPTGKAIADAFGKKFESMAVAPKRKPLLNKTEARWLARLKVEYPDKYIGCQNITFLLAPDLRYTPDFWMAPLVNQRMTFWEVKGPFIREDSMVKLKTAAAMFPMFTFILAQWKDGEWTTKTIPPL